MRRAGFVLAVGLALAAGAWVAAGLLARVWVLGRLPMWDAAGNGWGAVELWAALADGRVGDFLLRLNAQDKWPFGFSLLMLPFVAAGGGSFESAAMLPALAFALVPALLVWAGREAIGGGDAERGGLAGVVAGLLAGALWLVGPLPRALATVAMRETTGAALGVAVLAGYLRARRLGTLAAWRLVAALLLLLFFVKYNYFLLSGAALALHAVLEIEPARRRARLDELVRRARHGGWRSPWRWTALVLVVAAAIFLVGENPGNFLYGCLVVATVVGLSLQWKSRSRLREALDRRPPAARAFVEWLLVPLWLWSLSPRPIHPRSVFAFLRNRPGDMPPLSLDAMSFYPLALFEHYFVLGVVGSILAALALGGLVYGLRRGAPSRAVAFTVSLALLALVLHPMREDRFLATSIPALALLGSLTAVRLALRGLSAFAHLRRALALPLTFAAVAVVWSAALGRGALARLELDHRMLTAGPEYLAPLTAVAFWASEPGVGRVGLIGAFNEVAESAVRWEAWRGYGTERVWADPLRGLVGSTPADEVARRLDRWLVSARPDRLVVVRPLPRSRWLADADFRRYNAWQLVAAERVAAAPGWRVTVPARRFPDLGLQIAVLDRSAP